MLFETANVSEAKDKQGSLGDCEEWKKIGYKVDCLLHKRVDNGECIVYNKIMLHIFCIKYFTVRL
jgi:hypothetical protein